MVSRHFRLPRYGQPDTIAFVMIEVGPYKFTEGDIETTIFAAPHLLDGYPARVQAELAGLRAEFAQTIETSPPEDAVQKIFPRLLAEARAAVERAEALPETATGSVVQLNVSQGGVPKTPVDSVEVGFSGLEADSQNDRKHHGRPFQALCLWSEEIIEQLKADGHPIYAGAAGENVTIRGIDWTTLEPGTNIAIGSTLVQISSYAVPCGKQAQWFSDRDVRRLHHGNGEISRLYATVIEAGSISVGDEVTVEP